MNLTFTSEFIAINICGNSEERLGILDALTDIVLDGGFHLMQHHYWVHCCSIFWHLLSWVGYLHQDISWLQHSRAIILKSIQKY